MKQKPKAKARKNTPALIDRRELTWRVAEEIFMRLLFSADPVLDAVQERLQFEGESISTLAVAAARHYVQELVEQGLA